MNSDLALTAGNQPDSMDFMEFVAWSQHVSRTNPGVRRSCETRIGRALAHIQPVVEMPPASAAMHRCDPAQLWCDVRGLPSRYAKTTLICQGVRHGLGLILRLLAEKRQTVALPSDVYPVYWRIASGSQIDATGFTTFPRFDLQGILDGAARSGCFVVLLPSPLKLHGRHWTDAETAQAIRWLGEEPQRRLILDGVYSFGLPVGTSVRRLLETGQVIYLDSLSKGWLHEQVLGVALVPEKDFGFFADCFRELTLSQEKLLQAWKILSNFREFPDTLMTILDERRAALATLFLQEGLHPLPAAQGYFVAIERGASNLLEEHRLLTMPAAVFGSKLTQWSIASCLPVCDRT